MTRTTRRLGAPIGASAAAAVLVVLATMLVLATTGARADSATPPALPRPIPTFVPDGTVCYEVQPDRICHIPLELTGPVEAITAVIVSTVDGTARAGADYWPVSRLVVTIPVGVLSVDLRVGVVADGVAEPDETFYLVISALGEPARILQRIAVVIRDGAPPK